MPPKKQPLFLILLWMVVVQKAAFPVCYSATCGSCSPPSGVNFQLSTLIPPAAFPGTNADEPLAFVDPADGSARRLIAVQEGAVLVWDGATGSILSTPFLDLRSDGTGPGLDKVLYGGERGLLALAVDPDYIMSGWFWVFYTRQPDGDIVVERYQRSSGNPNVADPTSGTVILRIDHPASNHNGGWLAFGPDGLLYVSTGDGGGACDSGQGTNGDGQNPGTLDGKILRLDVRGVLPNPASPECGLDANYGVPASNPYVGVSGCDEVWALGLRNPFRFSFDRLTGDLYIGDVGQDNWEEINLIRANMVAPVNFGWACREGCAMSSTSPSNCSIPGCPAEGTTCQYPTASGKWDPILCHSNPNGWASIMGGYRYRGSRVPDLAGRYVYSDYACGQVWVTTFLDPNDPGATQAECWRSGFSQVTGFAQDHLGELYLIRGGSQKRIECIHGGTGCYWAAWRGMFEDDFESGNTSRWTVTFP
jgi:hypothetical protein